MAWHQAVNVSRKRREAEARMAEESTMSAIKLKQKCPAFHVLLQLMWYVEAKQSRA